MFRIRMKGRRRGTWKRRGGRYLREGGETTDTEDGRRVVGTVTRSTTLAFVHRVRTNLWPSRKPFNSVS